MGVKYALSVANLLMGKWKSEIIYGKRRKEFAFHKCFIHNVVIVWEGSEQTLTFFLREIGNIRCGILFSGTLRYEKIYFLDLTIFTDGVIVH